MHTIPLSNARQCISRVTEVQDPAKERDWHSGDTAVG